MSTHPPEGGGGAGSRRGRGRGRVPQCGPPGWTRLSHGDAWSGESTPACAQAQATAGSPGGDTLRAFWYHRGVLGQHRGGTPWSGARSSSHSSSWSSLACGARRRSPSSRPLVRDRDTGTHAWRRGRRSRRRLGRGVGTASIKAAQYPRDGGAALSPSRSCPASPALGGLVRGRRRHSNVTVVWKDGASVCAKRVDLDRRRRRVRARSPSATDAQAVALRGAGATVTPAGVAADGAGGAYVWCTAVPTSRRRGRRHARSTTCSSGRRSRRADPGLAVAKGTVAALAADSTAARLRAARLPRRTQARRRSATPPTSDADWTTPDLALQPAGAALAGGHAGAHRHRRPASSATDRLARGRQGARSSATR